jgi:hypothetical protein
MASKVLKRMAFALPVFKMERFESVNSTLSDNSLSDIFRFAIITSKVTIIHHRSNAVAICFNCVDSLQGTASKNGLSLKK